MGDSSDVSVRPYKPVDLEACRALWAELTQRHRDLYADPSIGGEAAGPHVDRHLARIGPGRIWVAECDGQVVRLAGLVAEGDEAEVEPIVGTCALRGKGIGPALLKHVVEEARQLGVRCLGVSPVARNMEAMRFYYDCGFRLRGSWNCSWTCGRLRLARGSLGQNFGD